MRWRRRRKPDLLVTSLAGPITVYLEPEGNDVPLDQGDYLQMWFPGATGAAEVSYVEGGIVVCRPPSRRYPTVTRKDGSPVDW